MARDERGKATLPEPHPERAPAVQRLFELRATLGSHETAQTMNREGWPCPNHDTAWTRDAVRRMTKNPGYAGNWAFGALTIEIPPLISVEAFETAQRNNRDRFIHRGPRADHLLSGVAYCAACGAAMSRNGDAKKRLPHGISQRWYYRCWRIRSERQKCTANTYYRQDQLEAMVWAEFVSTATNPEKLERLLRQAVPVEPDPERLIQQAQLDAAIARAWEPYTRGVPGVTFEMAQEAARPYVEQKARSSQTEGVKVPAIDVARVAEHLTDVLHQPMDSDGQRSWLKALHVKAYVRGGTVERLTMDIPKV